MSQAQNIIIYDTAESKASVAFYARDGKVWMVQGLLAKMFDQNIWLKCLVIMLLSCTFALTVLTTLPVRSASQGESFAFIYFSKIIHLPGLNSTPGRFFYACN